ncbi:MAG: recombinase family protein, partial [Armatimonadetes bacterium]|nr:recombinase family protein [Armatimonadota bacterium]
ITETFWNRKSAEWREVQLRLLAAMETHQRANEVYFEEGFRILELAGKAHDLWLSQPPEGKRKLLNLVQSNCTFDGVSLTATYTKPFCWLAEGSVCDNWLPDREAA